MLLGALIELTPIAVHNKQNFYEPAGVKTWLQLSFSRFISFATGGRSPSRVPRWVPRLAVRGEAGNPAILIPALPRRQSLAIVPPGLPGLSCAFRLAASV